MYSVMTASYMEKCPDHATVVYGNLIRKTYKDVPIIIGGIEASLRRMAHYDYWSDSFKRSILLDSSADLISYGMGEKAIVEIADALNSVFSLSHVRISTWITVITWHFCENSGSFLK